MTRMTDTSKTAALTERRRFIREALSGTLIVAFGGGLYALSDDLTREAQAAERKDGRPRLPPGQRVLSALRPMGGAEGDPRRSQFRLRVHGEVEQPFELDFRQLLSLPQTNQTCDVHCVTGWSVLDAKFSGVQVRALAEKAKPKPAARHVVFEAAHGYTANVRLSEALAPNVLVTHALSGEPLPRTHGGPVRALIPDLYFWKSAKWLTGIRFVARDEPGYWETRGYHNHADPWKEERYA
ncbi:MAG TPA: molybdopterin-dependent oxidoreductase [Polyangiaceae bacterium]|nr:molybdopterin-dependent oxidoreductase [Polyangiaceae bacterium]